MSGWLRLACSYTGAKRRHGPHQPAQKSTSTIPPLVTVCSNVSLVNATVAMSVSLSSGVPGSGQGQEQLLQLRDGPAPVLAATGLLRTGALLEPVPDDHESGAVDRMGHRDELGEHLHTVAAGLQHRHDTAELALGPVQPPHHVAMHVRVDLHDAPPSPQLPQIIPPGVSNPAGSKDPS